MQSSRETRSQSAYTVFNRTRFYKDENLALIANVGSFSGRRPGVTLSKWYRERESGRWLRSKKAFYLDLTGWNSLLNASPSINRMAEALVSRMQLFLYS